MLYAVIMAGGVGERFWPRSRIKRPKQLLNLADSKKTLIEQTCDRLSPLISKKNIFIVTNKQQKALIKKHVKGISVDQIIAEPMGRNTAACIGLAAKVLCQKDPNAIMVVLPADHTIPDKKKFQTTISSAVSAALEDKLVTIGIKPVRAETEYGYIEVGDSRGLKNVFSVKSFKEKPTLNKAKEFYQSGKFFWNSGMFVWKASVILDEIQKYVPGLYKQLNKIQKAKVSVGLLESIYSNLENISIDYGVLEKSKNVAVVKTDLSWDDLGLWTAMQRLYPGDKKNNIVIKGDFVDVESENNIVYSDEGIVGIVGLTDLIVIRDGDAVLVCPKERAKDVKALVGEMKKGKTKYL